MGRALWRYTIFEILVQIHLTTHPDICSSYLVFAEPPRADPTLTLLDSVPEYPRSTLLNAFHASTFWRYNWGLTPFS